MKVVFPCKGAIVLPKQDLETLKAFYNTNLLTSKLLDTYKTSNTMVQVGNLNYIPQKSYLILDNANFLTIDKMREILGLHKGNYFGELSNYQEDDANNTEISDDDILSNPFFQTLKPLN